MASSASRVIIVGAGLSGLAVAARLLHAGREVVVLEASAQVGGQIHTHRGDGLVVELGAEGFVARSRSVAALATLLGIEAAMIEQLTTDTYALSDGRLSLLPPGEAARRLGFQVPPEELGRGIRSFALGMGQLIEVLAERVGASRIRLSTPVTALSREGADVAVRLSNEVGEKAGAVVLATPARVAAALAAPLGLPELEPLGSAPLLSNVSVNLLYQREQVGSCPAGSGVIFPEGFASVGLRAFSIVGHKFAGRVGPEQALLRVFFRPVGDALSSWSDERYAREAHAAIAGVLPLTGEPRRAWVSRWADALPVFSPEYQAVAAAADRALQAQGVHVVGSAYHGAGIDAAVASAELVALRLSG